MEGSQPGLDHSVGEHVPLALVLLPLRIDGMLMSTRSLVWSGAPAKKPQGERDNGNQRGNDNGKRDDPLPGCSGDPRRS
jgi:hypothetical protein